MPDKTELLALAGRSGLPRTYREIFALALAGKRSAKAGAACEREARAALAGGSDNADR